MILYCVRHGESLYNAENRIQGQSDVPLSELGIRQAAATAEAMANVKLDAIYSSPLSRALETAQMAAALHGMQVHRDDRLMEIHAGVFQGHLRSELQEKFPDESRRWEAKDPDFTIPEGESRRDLMRRGEQVFRVIRETGHERVAVFSHGGLLTAALKALLEIPANRHPFKLHNAAISRLGWEDELVLETINEIEHLREVGVGGIGDL